MAEVKKEFAQELTAWPVNLENLPREVKPESPVSK